jgi:hypothetical protein
MKKQTFLNIHYRRKSLEQFTISPKLELKTSTPIRMDILDEDGCLLEYCAAVW